MHYNNKIVENILSTKFANEIDDFVMRDLHHFDPEECYEELSGKPEYFGLIAVTDLSIIGNIETEETGDNTTAVYGDVNLEIEANALDEEGMSCGETTLNMVYNFNFEVTNDNKYENLYMEWVD